MPNNPPGFIHLAHKQSLASWRLARDCDARRVRDSSPRSFPLATAFGERLKIVVYIPNLLALFPRAMHVALDLSVFPNPTDVIAEKVIDDIERKPLILLKRADVFERPENQIIDF